MVVHLHPYEKVMSVPAEDIQFELRGHSPISWDDFWLNPRRLRGSDFLMRWSQGRWSEDRIIEAVNKDAQYCALPYGLSSVAPDEPREYELYWERLEKAGLGQVKRPDLLILRGSDKTGIQEIVQRLGGLEQLPFTPEEHTDMQGLLSKAVVAIECENSLWVASQMPDYGKPLKPQKRLGGRLGLRKNPVLSNIIIKDEDRIPLKTWQNRMKVPIHIWQVFYDMAIGISLDEAERVVETGLIEPTTQVFQAPGGASQSKATFRIYHHYTYPVGSSREEPELVAASITDKNGHILPYVRFEGGVMELRPEAIQVLTEVAANGV